MGLPAAAYNLAEMRQSAKIAVIIPALNEEEGIGRVLDALPHWVDHRIVADNGSTDSTAETARRHGAHVVSQPERGYGAACLAGIAACPQDVDVLVFLDGDFADDPGEMASLVDSVIGGEADMVIGSRVLGARERGALTPQARFGNWLSCLLLRKVWGVRYTDLGPFRAIRKDALERLEMADRNYGWTVEMQVKAAKAGLRAVEVPVSYRRRIGRSKVSGTVKGVVLAGTKILYTIFREAVGPVPAPEAERLIVFTRYPHPGRVKTRLIPELGAEGAAALQREMIAHVVDAARQVSRQRGARVEIRHAGGEESVFREWLGKDLIYREQSAGDLGERMHGALAQALEQGGGRAVLFGTDVPGLSPAILHHALDALKDHDAVIGPASDGGYYLLGLRRDAPRLFHGIEWSTGEVFEKTARIAMELGLSLAKVDELRDVDRPEDLEAWRALQNRPD